MSTSACPQLALVQTTTATHAEAERIGLALLRQGLAACVQYAPIRSQYCWQGNIECADEVQLDIKTTQALFAQVAAAISALHPYDCPQIIMLPVQAAHRP